MLQLGLLGPFALSSDGRGVKLPRKAEALLGYLAVHRGQAIARDRLAYLLWPDSAEARHGLRNTLFAIRRVLGPSCDRWLRADAQAVSLAGAELEIDLTRFEAAAGSASAAELADAAGLYRGEFLQDMRTGADPFEEWLAEMREQVLATASEIFRALAAAASQNGDFTAAIAAARRLVELDRLSEANHRTLIETYFRAGQRSLALRQYNACAEIVQREFGVGPEPETLALQRRLQSPPENRPAPGSAAAIAPPPERGRGDAQRWSPAAPLPKPLPGPLEEALTRSWFKAERLSVGVVPLRDLTDGALPPTVLEGLTEDLIFDLAGLGRGFTVTRVRSDALERGIDLVAGDVRYVVTGNVQRGCDRLRISVSLIDALSAEYLWTQRYECDAGELGSAQVALTGRISRELHLQVIHETSRSLLARDLEQDSDELVEDGMFLLTRSSRLGPAPVREAQVHFLRALARDRRSIGALAGLGHCCFRLASHPYWLPTSGMLPGAIDLGREAVRAALAIDRNNAYAHCIDGMLSSVAGDLEHARDALGRSIALDPDLALPRPFAGYNAAFFGRAEETAPAAESVLRAHPNDPASGAWLFLAGAGELLLGRHEQAVSLLESSLASDATAGTPRLFLAAAKSLGGELAAGQRVLVDFRERYPAYRLRDFTQQFVTRSRHPTYRRQVEVVLQQLRELGLPQ